MPMQRRERRSLRASLSRRSLRRTGGGGGGNFGSVLQHSIENEAECTIGRALRAKLARESVLRVLHALAAVVEGAAKACSLPALAAAARLVGGLRPNHDAVLWAQMRAAAALHRERANLAAVDHAWEAVRRARNVVQYHAHTKTHHVHTQPHVQGHTQQRQLEQAEMQLNRAMQLIHPISYRQDAAEVARVLSSLTRIVKKRKLGWRGEYGSGWQDAVRTERRFKPSKPNPNPQPRSRDTSTATMNATKYRDVLSYAHEAVNSGKTSPESIRATADLFEQPNHNHHHLDVDFDHENVYPSTQSKQSTRISRSRTQVQNLHLQPINAAILVSRAWRARAVRQHASNHLLQLNHAFIAHTKAINQLHASLRAVNSVNQAHPLHDVTKRLAARALPNHLTTSTSSATAAATATASARSRALANAASTTLMRALRALAVRRRNIPVRLRRMRATVSHALSAASASRGDVESHLKSARDTLERLAQPSGVGAITSPAPTITRTLAALRLRLDAAVRARQRVEQLRARNAADAAVAAAKEDARAQAAYRIARWTHNGKYKGDLRSLLATLHRVLPPDAAAVWKHSTATNVTATLSASTAAGATPSATDENATPNKVRAIYRKALLHVHPDRLTARHATPDEHALAHLVFVQLQEAYSIFARKELTLR